MSQISDQYVDGCELRIKELDSEIAKLREENRKLKIENDLMKPSHTTEAMVEWQKKMKQAKETGARSGIEYVCSHYAVNAMATPKQMFEYWKQEQK